MVEGDLTELWIRYGQLFEIWFDGGVVTRQDGGADVAKLLEEYQPQAICFQGPKEHGQNLRWIGNEDGEAPFDTWSTADQKVCHFDGKSRDELIGSGVPGGKYWFPTGRIFCVKHGGLELQKSFCRNLTCLWRQSRRRPIICTV